MRSLKQARGGLDRVPGAAVAADPDLLRTDQRLCVPLLRDGNQGAVADPVDGHGDGVRRHGSGRLGVYVQLLPWADRHSEGTYSGFTAADLEGMGARDHIPAGKAGGSVHDYAGGRLG